MLFVVLLDQPILVFLVRFAAQLFSHSVSLHCSFVWVQNCCQWEHWQPVMGTF